VKKETLVYCCIDFGASSGTGQGGQAEEVRTEGGASDGLRDRGGNYIVYDFQVKDKLWIASRVTTYGIDGV